MEKMRKTKAKTRKISVIFMLIILIISASAVLYATEPETTDIVCQDVNLYDALVEELDDFVYRSDRTTKTIRIPTTNIESITDLKLTGKTNARIADLTGMEYFTSLENLNLSGNNIASVEQISEITTLKILNISGNQTTITDLDTLANLVNLVNVNFASSKLTNVNFMSGYSQLEVLDISGNTISSLEPIQGITALKKLNISNNASFNRFQSDICCHLGLTELDISGTAIQVLDGIETNLRNLETLKLRYLDVELDPIVKTYRTEIDGENVYVPYLDRLKVLDISYTTKSISFKNISALTSLTHLYMIDVVGKWKNSATTTKLQLSGIYDLQDLQYINLASNNIEKLDGIVYEKYNKEILVEKKFLGATEIYLQDNNISNLELLMKLEQPITILNLSYNKISEIEPLENCNFSASPEVDLRHQDVTLDIYKKASVDQYIILPSIFQESKREGSLVYADDTNFVVKCNEQVNEEIIRLNTDEQYLKPDYYNVIINKTTDKNAVLTLQMTGKSKATGSKITFALGTSSSNIDSLLFKDPNLCQAINDNLELEEYANRVKYIKNANLIMNINNSAIKNIDRLHLGDKNISDLTGMESFTGLTNLVLSDNKITTLDQLQYCTKMLILEVANNNIGNNNSAITQMVGLEQLDLTNTNMTNINSIETLIDYWTSQKRFPLKNLRISGNGFTNSQISRISEIISLTELYVANNKLEQVESFENLKGTLSIFDASQNKIEDISTVGTFTNLISLNLSNNMIKNISPIANCARLTELNLSSNKIEDISSLESLAGSGNLYVLNLNNNKIKDVSAVDRSQISQSLSAESQKIAQIIPGDTKGIFTIQLPPIFVSANNANSRFYDNGEGAKISVVGKEEGTDVSEYCTMSADKSSLDVNVDKLKDNNIITVKIQDGNADDTTLSIGVPLKGTITYSPSSEIPTNQNVTATITFNRTATITNNEGKNTYTFAENGEFTFKYVDEYGFEGTATAKVENIDKIVPQGTMKQEIVDKKVIVTISVSEEIITPDTWTQSNDKLSITKTYSNDANETVKLKDLAGNETPIQVQVKIDKTAPVISGVKNGEKYTKPVTPIVTDENIKTITLTKDGINAVKFQSGTIIKEPGQYVLTAIDTFENTTTVSFEIEISDIITSVDEKITVSEDELRIKDISPKTKAEDLKDKLSANMNYEIIDKSGNAVSNESNVGTGFKIKMANNKIYTLVINGDTTGDGLAELRDILAINKHRLGKAYLTNEYLLAGDVNKDGKVELKDILQINKFRLGKINEL